MTSFPRFPKVESLLGARVDDLTADHLAHACGRIREDTDLEFKGAHYGEDDKAKNELAKDIAALANTLGGLLILGVREEDGLAVELKPIELSEDVELRMRQVIASRVAPFFPVHFHRVPVDAAGKLGYYVIGVARSPNAPHAVRLGESLRYPVRNGASTRSLFESEVADTYRSRFRGAEEQAARLGRVATESIDRLDLRDSVWLSLSTVPNAPGQFFLGERTLGDVHRWFALQPVVVGPGSRSRHGFNSSTGLRRAMLSDHLDFSEKAQSWYAELHVDGSSFIAIRHWDKWKEETPLIIAPILALQLCHLVEASVGFAVQHAAASGDAICRVDVLGTHFPLHLSTDDRMGSIPLSPTHGSRPFPRSISVARTVNIDAAFNASRDRLATAKLFADDIVQAFGLPESSHISSSGALRVNAFGGEMRGYLRKWAPQHQLELCEE